MTAFKNRPTAFFAAVFILSSVIFIELEAKYKPIIIAVAFAAAIMYIAFGFALPKSKYGALLTAVILTASAVACSALCVYFNVDKQIIISDGLIGSTADIKAEIVEIKSESVYSGAYVANVLTIDGAPSNIKIRLETEFSADLSAGDVITVRARFEELTDDGAYDLKTNGFREGITGLAVSDDVDTLIVCEHRDGVMYRLNALRERICAALAVSSELSGGDCGLMQALFVGDRSALDGTVRRDFTYVGISHLLAVSGMHLSIVIGGLELVLNKLTLHKTAKNIIVIAVTVCYMGLTGFSMSVLRAGIMLILYRLSYFFGRGADRITSLFIAVAGIIFVFPFAAADVGLLLSFSAMLACIVSSEATPSVIVGFLSRLRSKNIFSKALSAVLRFVLFNLSMSLYSMIFTMPIMWIYFGRISLLAPVGTLVLSLPITAILYLTPFALVSINVTWLWAVFQYPAAWLCRLTARLTSALTKIDGAELLLPTSDSVTAIFSIVTVIAVMLILLLPKRGARAAGCAAVAVFAAVTIASVGYSLTYDKNTVFYLNNGKNDGFVVSDGARALIVDISNGGGYISSALDEVAREELRANVNAFMLTHLHHRHLNTVERMLSSEYIEKLILPLPNDEDEAEVCKSLHLLAEKYGAEVVSYAYGTEVEYGDIMIDTASAYIERSSHPVLFLSIKSEGERTSYIGSSVHESELFSLALDAAQCSDTVIFGIHGPIVRDGADYFLTGSQAVVYATPELKSLFENALANKK